MDTEATRREGDLLGVLEIPIDAYWGIHTGRAVRNFPISGRPVRPGLIRAFALVKKACALANLELGYLTSEKGEAIIAACGEIAAGASRTSSPLTPSRAGRARRRT